jgi:hypothetical protein
VTIIAAGTESDTVSAAIQNLCPNNAVATVPSSDDLIIWRECRGLSLNSFPHLFPHFPTGDEHLTALAHARSDIDWDVVPAG